MTDPRTAPTQQYPTSLLTPDAAPERTMRAGTVVWGLILFVVAALTFVVTTLEPDFVTGEVVVWAVVGLGAVLVAAGVIGAIARAARRRDDD
ncbi:hypothetical protein [Marisediminicola sp. LYQ85]|uniref:hypothetical protein n=1 Tax=Marisediminicola sp. LYQ85 TaxID=3391062 RepID=UPI0039839863